jgi:hypothetical protein
MRFLPEGLNTFKIQIRLKLELISEFYNSQSREILELDQKGKLGHLKLSITMPSFENFGNQESFVLYF